VKIAANGCTQPRECRDQGHRSAIGKRKKRNVIGLMGSDEVVVLDNDRLRQIGKVGRDAGSAAAATDQ
jgi:hypothetical protein